MSPTAAPVADVSALAAVDFARALRDASRRMMATLDAALAAEDPRAAVDAAIACLDADTTAALGALFPVTRTTR